MGSNQKSTLAQKMINKDKWWDTLSRFIDVLRINIFIVDHEGRMVLPPDDSKFGGALLMDNALGFDLMSKTAQIQEQFRPYDGYWEIQGRFQLHSFAIPVKTNDGQLMAFMVVGPVILNRRLNNEDYERWAKEYNVDVNKVLDQVLTLRVVSNVMIKSILDLLAEIIRDNVALQYHENELSQFKYEQKSMEKKVNKASREIYAQVVFDELLVTFLDVSLKIANMETGSIMVLDDDNGDLTIKVSRGLDQKRVQQARIKPGQGVAGMAFQENAHFIIGDQQTDARLRPYLKRPEIKHSVVMPLKNKNRVFGVLSLNTTQNDGVSKDNIENLQYLTQLITSTF